MNLTLLISYMALDWRPDLRSVPQMPTNAGAICMDISRDFSIEVGGISDLYLTLLGFWLGNLLDANVLDTIISCSPHLD